MDGKENRNRDIALFRYALVREAADPALSPAERGELVRALASVEHLGPSGRYVKVSRPTLDRWIRTWRAGGFDALMPTPRRGVPIVPGSCWLWRSTSRRRRRGAPPCRSPPPSQRRREPHPRPAPSSVTLPTSG